MKIEEIKESIKDTVDIGCSLHVDHEDCIELFEYLKKLEADKLEAYKIILGLERQNFTNNDVDSLIQIVNKANKYIEEVEK